MKKVVNKVILASGRPKLFPMHSCTQGSGTALHLNLFFFWFSPVFKNKYIIGLIRMLTMFSRVFVLAVCDPSP